jgi:hypothetical protein
MVLIEQLEILVVVDRDCCVSFINVGVWGCMANRRRRSSCYPSRPRIVINSVSRHATQRKSPP